MPPRTNKNWGTIRTEIYRLLREDENANPFWSPADLLQLANEERTYLQAVLGEAFEGWTTIEVQTDLVGSTEKYQLPSDANRVLKVLRVFEGGRKEPLERLERWSEASTGSSGGTAGFAFLPTYSLEGDFIVLDPPPTDGQTNGLAIVYEQAAELVVQDTDDFIPAAWPFICEDYLKWAIAVAAFEIEGAMGPEAQGYYSSLIAHRDRYFTLLREYIEERSYGRNFGSGFLQAD